MNIDCPFLQVEVELSQERLQHIISSHPELGADVAQRISLTLQDPDEIRVDSRFPDSRLFSRWFDDLLRGKILVVAVVTDDPKSMSGTSRRHWIVTAYPARRITRGGIVWARP